MKTVVVSRFMGAIAIMSALGTTSAQAQNASQTSFEPRTFTYSSVSAPATATNRAILSLFEAVERRTGGAVTFETFWQGSLCSASEVMECVSTGQVDIGFGSAVFNPASLPITQIGSVPFQIPGRLGQGAMNAVNAMYRENEDLRAEWDRLNLRPLYFMHGATPLLASTKPIETLDDVRGMSIRTVGFIVRPLAEIGANIVAVSPSDQYEALERGVLEGTIYPTDGLLDMRLYEVVDHVYDLGEYMGNYAMYYQAINKDVWDSMAPELQAIFTDEVDRIAATYHLEFLQNAETVACETLAREVAHIGRFADEPSATAWAEEMRELIMDEWVSAATAAGVANAGQLRDEYRERLAAFEGGDEYRSGGQLCIEAAASR